MQIPAAAAAPLRVLYDADPGRCLTRLTVPFPPPLPEHLRYTWRPHRHGTLAEPLVRAWLATELGTGAAGLALERDPHGRPRLRGAQAGHDVSWSHSGEHLLIALGRGVELGVDLERLRPRPRALELAGRFFHPHEAAWLRDLAAAERELAFVRLWCAKEAVLKAHGRGLAFGLHRLEFGPGAAGLRLRACDPALGAPGDWSLHESAPRPGYRAALAWRPRQAGAQAQ
jgi:4'-phosphopantetheinyl transferase